MKEADSYIQTMKGKWIMCSFFKSYGILQEVAFDLNLIQIHLNQQITYESSLN